MATSHVHSPLFGMEQNVFALLDIQNIPPITTTMKHAIITATISPYYVRRDQHGVMIQSVRSIALIVLQVDLVTMDMLFAKMKQSIFPVVMGTVVIHVHQMQPILTEYAFAMTHRTIGCMRVDAICVPQDIYPKNHVQVQILHNIHKTA